MNGRPLGSQAASLDARGEAKGVALRFMTLGGSHFLGGIIGFVATLVSARALGDSGYGAVAVALALQAYALAVVSFGTDIYAVPRVSSDHDEAGPLLAMTTLLGLILTLPVALIMVGLAVSGAFDAATSLAIGVMSISVLFFAFTPFWVPKALEEVGIVAAATIGSQVATMALILGAAFFELPPWAYVAAKVISDLGLAVFLFGWARRRAGSLNILQAWPRLKSEFTRILPLGWSQLIRSAMLTLDVAILGLFAAAPEVGQYAVAYRIYIFALAIANRYFVVLLPLLSRSFKSGLEDARKELRTSLVRTIPLLAISLIIAVFLSRPLLHYAFGEDFADAAPALLILAFSACLGFVGQSYRMVLIAAAGLPQDLRNGAMAATVKMVAIFALSWWLGMLGAALAMLAGDLTALILQRRSALRILDGTDPLVDSPRMPGENQEIQPARERTAE